ncbi:MAG: peptidylprolyl isomerase [Stackebrandtia sp.]
MAAVAVLAGLGYFFFTVIENNSGGEDETAEEPAPERTDAADGNPKEKVTIESLAVTEPASVDDGAAKCEFTPLPEEQLAANPGAVDVGTPGDGEKPATGTQEMVIETDHGTISVELDTEKAPCAAANFTYLGGEAFYDDSICHRLTTENIFVLQCGNPAATGEDPQADGAGGPTYSFKNENEPRDTMKDLSEEEQAEMQSNPEAEGPEPNYPAGTLALANSGPDTNGSQFFLVYEDTYLPPDYSIVGKIDEKGLEVIREIAAAGADAPVTEEQQQPMPMG